jgi:hypothetical protein
MTGRSLRLLALPVVASAVHTSVCVGRWARKAILSPSGDQTKSL